MNIDKKLNHVNTKVMYLVTLCIGGGKGNTVFITIRVTTHSTFCMITVSKEQCYKSVLHFPHILKPISHQKNLYVHYVVISDFTKLKIMTLVWFQGNKFLY
jgi:hypothetical protein